MTYVGPTEITVAGGRAEVELVVFLGGWKVKSSDWARMVWRFSESLTKLIW